MLRLILLTAILFRIGNAQAPERTPETVAAGRTAFLEACSACHGTNGEGGHGPGLVGPRIRRASDKQLFNAIHNGVPGTDMPPFKLAERTIFGMIAFLRDLSAPAGESNIPGDVAAGREVFFGQAGCSNCHMIRGKGGFLGPDLSESGITRTVAQLREGLLQPNARVAPGFEAATFTGPEGKKLKAVVKHRTNYSLQLIDAAGALHMLRDGDLDKAVLQSQSWMPADYSQRLTPEQIQNLLAFLGRQSIRGAQTE